MWCSPFGLVEDRSGAVTKHGHGESVLCRERGNVNVVDRGRQHGEEL
jgi:hypothetical protein